MARIVPGTGVELEGGERIEAPCVVSNADPRTTLRLLGDAADPAWRARVEAIPQVGCTVKLNVALSELPELHGPAGHADAPSPGPDQHAADQGRSGRPPTMRPGPASLPDRLWTELYFQTAHDPSVAPEGVHTHERLRPVRAAHLRPRRLGDSRREEVKDLALRSIGRFCDNMPGAVIDVQVLGPPDIEREVGLTGGHIFQGECLPPYMWDRRLEPRTPMPGVFLCGACTHPGGSVIAINGRNAAMEVLGEKPRT